MSGNASEWVLDRYYNKYDVEAPAIGDVEQPRDFQRHGCLMRGGFWESGSGRRNPRLPAASSRRRTSRSPWPCIRCAAERK